MSNKANIAVTSGLMKGKSFLSMSMILSLSDGWLDVRLPAGHEPDMRSAHQGRGLKECGGLLCWVIMMSVSML